MNRLIRHISTRWMALPVLAMVVAALVTPTPAIAAPVSSASPGKVSAAAPTYKFTDLGDLEGYPGYVGGINNKGDVAATRGTKAVLFTGGTVVDVHATLPGKPSVSQSMGVADDGTVAGKFSYYFDPGKGTGEGFYSGAFLYQGGSSVSLSPLGKPLVGARGMNNAGQVTGGGWVRDRNGSMLRLEAFDNQRIDAMAISDLGAVVGGADLNPDPKVMDYAAFRTEPGQPIDVKRDRLNFSGTALAYDVNEAGQVAGYGRDTASDVDVPVIWDKDGFAYEFDTPMGGVVMSLI